MSKEALTEKTELFVTFLSLVAFRLVRAWAPLAPEATPMALSQQVLLLVLYKNQKFVRMFTFVHIAHLISIMCFQFFL